MHSALSATPAVLTIEIDPKWIMAGQRPPEPLSRDAAEVLAAALAADLQRILGDGVREVGLVVPAAIYDITELLQPGLPKVETMLDVYRSSLRGGPFEAHLLALGSSAGRFPVAELAPARAAGSGPLLAIPFALVAPGPTLENVREQLERHLLEKGRASLDTDRVIRGQFGMEPVNLAYATFHDLGALLRVQLDHAGFSDLWRLLEGALYRPDEPLQVTLPSGNRFLGLFGQVWTPVLGFDAWVDRHAPTADPATALEGYADWQKAQRQYVAGLMAHGVQVIPVSARPGVYSGDVETALSVAQQALLSDPQRLTVTVAGDPEFDAPSAVLLTEQTAAEIGPFAYTVLVQDASGSLGFLGHEYPMTPEALMTIRDHWQQRAARLGAGFQIERPERAVVSGEPARLMPWLEYGGQA
jgi:hypothetical protein